MSVDNEGFVFAYFVFIIMIRFVENNINNSYQVILFSIVLLKMSKKGYVGNGAHFFFFFFGGMLEQQTFFHY